MPFVYTLRIGREIVPYISAEVSGNNWYPLAALETVLAVMDYLITSGEVSSMWA